MNKRILIVDDDEALLRIYEKVFRLKGFEVDVCTNGIDALNLIKHKQFMVIISDVIMPKMDGMELLKEIKSMNSSVEVIMLTAEGSIDDAVKAVKAGAFSYIVKPANMDKLAISVDQAVNLSKTKYENETLKEQIAVLKKEETFLGSSPVACELREQIKIIGTSDSTVLITGETGTGKEVVANLIHSFSSRKDKPFICVNCAALNENLIESELFGAEKGAYTGADKRRKGRFELADGGTLFFDEIGELQLSMQVKLLRVIQEKSFERVGGTEPIQSDFRLIAATNRDLKAEVKKGTFRADLFYRLNIIPIMVNPLRERPQDIREIVNYFLEFFAREMNYKVPDISEEMFSLFQRYTWPGNVRELRNIVERLVVLSRNKNIDIEMLPEELIENSNNSLDYVEGNLKSYMQNVEKEYIQKLIDTYPGDLSRIADELGIAKRSLYRKIHEYDLETH